MIPPPEIMQRLALFCEEHNLGMAMIADNDSGVNIIIMANRVTTTPETAALIAANNLITGVLNHHLAASNDQAHQRESAEKMKVPN